MNTQTSLKAKPSGIAGISFPSARYFQVHFEQLHEQLSLTTRQLVILSDRVQDLEREVNRLNEDPGPP